jgi:hypothetical protein
MLINLKGRSGSPLNPIKDLPGFTDNFNRASGDAIGFTSGENRPYLLAGTGTAPSWKINSTGGAYLASGSGGLNVAVLNGLSPDGTLQVTAKTLGSSRRGGLAFRYRDIDNLFMLYQASNTSPLGVYRRLNGATAVQVAISTYTPADGDVYQVILAGNNIQVLVNGAQIMSLTDSNLASETRHGLYGSSLAFSMMWDDLSFTAA